MRQGKRSEAAEINSQILKENPNDNDARGLAATFLLDQAATSPRRWPNCRPWSRALPITRFRATTWAAPITPAASGNRPASSSTRPSNCAPITFWRSLSLAQLQVNRGEFDAALKTAEAVLAIDSGNVNARLIESAALMGQKRFGDSRTMLDAMLKSNPGSPDVLFQLGVVNLAENRFKEAEDAFRRAYQLNPANSRGLMGIVETNMAQNKTDEALKLLQAESDKAPNRTRPAARHGQHRGARRQVRFRHSDL